MHGDHLYTYKHAVSTATLIHSLVSMTTVLCTRAPFGIYEFFISSSGYKCVFTHYTLDFHTHTHILTPVTVFENSCWGVDIPRSVKMLRGWDRKRETAMQARESEGMRECCWWLLRSEAGMGNEGWREREGNNESGGWSNGKNPGYGMKNRKWIFKGSSVIFPPHWPWSDFFLV